MTIRTSAAPTLPVAVLILHSPAPAQKPDPRDAFAQTELPVLTSTVVAEVERDGMMRYVALRLE